MLKQKKELLELEKGKSQKAPDVPRHRFPTFNEKTDDLDTFFQSFECQANLLKVNESELKSYLLSCLSGKAREIFNSLPFESDYESTKNVLLQRYNFTPNEYRRKFFNACPSSEENISTYVHRISMYFDRWISLSKTRKDFDSIRDLIIRHIVLSNCNVKLSQFLLEKDINNLDSIVTESIRFFSAHNDETLSKKESYPLISNVSVTDIPDRGRSDRRKYDRNQSLSQDRKKEKDFVHNFHKVGGNRRSSSCFSPRRNNTNDMPPHSNNFNNKQRNSPRSNLRCFNCSGFGHVKSNCPSVFFNSFASQFNWREKKDFPLNKPESLNSFSATCTDREHHIYDGLLGETTPKNIKVLRDTGSMVHAIHMSLVEPHELTNDTVTLITFGGNKECFRIARVFVDTPFIKGYILACVIERYPSKHKCYDVLIGNGTTPCTPEIYLPTVDVIKKWEDEHKMYLNCESRCDNVVMSDVAVNTELVKTSHVIDHIISDSNTDLKTVVEPMLHSNQVTTRAQSKNNDPIAPLCNKVLNLDISEEELSTLQKSDPSLQKYFDLAENTLNEKKVKNGSYSFSLCNGKLIRKFRQKGVVYTQLIVPTCLRNRILSLSHDTPLGGHCSIKKTNFLLTQSFFWPGISNDVKKYCNSCDICQKTRSKGRNIKAPLQTHDFSDTKNITLPFSKIAIDIVGELPMTTNKNRYILTVIDYATRWVEAIPLKNIDTVTVSEALCTIFTRFGFPSEVLSDGGPQFTSDLMYQVMKSLGITHKFTTPYHPQANGLCEKANGTIKNIIRKVAFDNTQEWDRYLHTTLYNIRSTPQETTGFTPFELVFGFPPSTLHSRIRDNWLGDNHCNEKPLHQYVIDLRSRILKSCLDAARATASQQAKSKIRYDKSAKMRKLVEGDKVLLLLSNNTGKIDRQWSGPFEVTEVVSPVNYKISINGKEKKYHINMLQKYNERPASLTLSENEYVYANSAIVFDNDLDDNEGLTQIEIPPIECSENYTNVKINNELYECQYKAVQDLLYKFSTVFSDLPGSTEVIEHKIELSDYTPIKLKPYPLPFSSHEVILKEIQNMLNMGIIQESQSPFAAPIVLVKKKDGKTRFCVDYRKLNLVTIGDATPIPDQELLFTRLHDAKIFTKLDLTKGYWQVKMDESSQKYTAFISSQGLYEFIKMPFGLKNCPATFNKLMSKLLSHRQDCLFFFDDVIIFHIHWISHLQALHDIFDIFYVNGLTIRPSKTEIAFHSISFLGHVVGTGTIKPISDNVYKILNIVQPKTKKQVRSIIGLVNYYAKFIPHISTLLTPLSNLIVKGKPDKPNWTADCQKSVEIIQHLINRKPVLILPNINKPFFIQTDASIVGIGAVLLQLQEDCLRPCLFVSRKLLERETRYSTMEKECLAIIWGVTRFKRYILGRHFTLQTDHNPLKFLKTAAQNNSRIHRWTLILEQYDFTIEHIPGRQNILADFLSRNF